MAGEATLTQSDAILKTRYEDGLPKAQFDSFKKMATINRREDLSGRNKVFAVNSENPQGVGPTMTDALANKQQSTFHSYTVTFVKGYAVAEIQGDAMKLAEGDEGALVDLWTNETDQVSQECIKDLEIASFRNGTGVIGAIKAGETVSNATIGLSQPADAANFSIGMTVQLVSSLTSLSPTIRSSGATAKITKVDRVAGTLTFAAGLSTYIAAAAAGDGFVRNGNAAVSGVSKVICGAGLWVAGGSSPADLFGCVRSDDPVRYAGQSYDATNAGMEDALIEAEARLIAQGYTASGLTAHCNPNDLKEFKKSLSGRTILDKTNVKAPSASVGFKAVVYEGESGPITLMSNPFCPVTELHLENPKNVYLESADACPHLQAYENLRFVRKTDDDVWQSRFAYYGQQFYYRPFENIRILNWGVQA